MSVPVPVPVPVEPDMGVLRRDHPWRAGVGRKRALNELLQPGVELLDGLKGELRLVGGHLTSLHINGTLLWNSKLDIASSPGQLTHPRFTCVLWMYASALCVSGRGSLHETQEWAFAEV